MLGKKTLAGCMKIAINYLYGFEDLAVSMFRGLHPIPDEEVIAMYDGIHVPLENMSDFYGKVNIHLPTCCDPLQAFRILMTLFFYPSFDPSFDPNVTQIIMCVPYY